MRIRGRALRLRSGLLLPLAAVLGGSVVILPAVASSETAGTIEAFNEGGIYGVKHVWKPPTATVVAGGGLNFANPTAVAHGVEWRSGPTTPSCSAGVPVGNSPASSGTKWNGTCTFAQPGVYELWCTVHHQEMSAVITVNANGTTTTTSTPPTTGTSPGGSGGGPQGSSGAGGAASPLAGSASSAVKLASAQRGASVRGSVNVSAAGAGGQLTVVVFAKSAGLATAGHAARVRVGRLVLSHLRSGQVTFSVPLNGRARAALRRHHRLVLTVRLQIQAAGGSRLTIARGVTLRS